MKTQPAPDKLETIYYADQKTGIILLAYYVKLVPSPSVS